MQLYNTLSAEERAQLIDEAGQQRLTLSYCFQILSVKLKELESLHSHLHKKEKSVILSTLNTKKVTTSMIHAERTFASAKMQGMLKRHKEAME